MKVGVWPRIVEDLNCKWFQSTRSYVSQFLLVMISKIEEKVKVELRKKGKVKVEVWPPIVEDLNCKWFQSPRPYVSYFLLVISRRKT